MTATERLTGAHWTERYECLRAEVLGAGRKAIQGLAIFLRQGMGGWMWAWERQVAPSRPSPRPTPGPVAEPGLQAGLSGQVAEVLASMILQCCQGGAR